jgi:hypothetical protein
MSEDSGGRGEVGEVEDSGEYGGRTSVVEAMVDNLFERLVMLERSGWSPMVWIASRGCEARELHG